MEEQFQQQRKILTQYLDKATEVEKLNPKIAYYCRLYASQQVILSGKKSSLHPKIEDVLRSLIEKLESTKKEHGFGTPEDQQECEVFAQMIFAKADKRDRAGQSDATTRSVFYSAWQFFNVASQFKNPMSDVSNNLRKYAMWRATEIQKAIKQGQIPGPPPPVEGIKDSIGKDADAELMESLNSLPGVPANVPEMPSSDINALSPPLPPPSTNMSKVDTVDDSTRLEDKEDNPNDDVPVSLPTGGFDTNSACTTTTTTPSTTSSIGVTATSGSLAMPPVPPSPVILTQAPSIQTGEEEDTDGAPSEYPLPFPRPPIEVPVIEQQVQNQQQQPLPPPPSIPPPVSIPAAAVVQPVVHAMPQSHPVVETMTPIPSALGPSPQALMEAQKAAKSAASALQFDDSNTAIKLLTDALNLLTNPSFSSRPKK